MAVRRLGGRWVREPGIDGRADAAVVHRERAPGAAKSDNAHQEGESHHRAAAWGSLRSCDLAAKVEDFASALLAASAIS